MKIHGPHKPYLNYLIAYYRRKLSENDENFLSKNFIYDNEGFPICTLSTLSRLENNKTQCFDKIYYNFLDNLDMVYENNTRINKLISDVNISILKYAEYNDRKNLTTLLKKTIHILSSYNNHIIYQEYNELYEMFLQFYQDFEFDKVKIDKAITFFPIIDPTIQAIVIDIAYQYYSKINIDHYHSLDIAKMVDSLTIDSTIKEYYVLTLHFRKYNVSEIKALAELLIKKYKKSNNNYFLCKVYNIYAILFFDSNPSLTLEYLSYSVHYYNEHNDFKRNLCGYLRNLGTTACINKNYKLAVRTFNRIIKDDKSLLIPIFPYYIYSLEKENYKENYILKLLIYLEEHKHQTEENSCFFLFELLKIKYGIEPATQLTHTTSNLINNHKLLIQMPSVLEITQHTLYDICKNNQSLQIYFNFVNFFSK